MRLTRDFKVSERRACVLIDQNRSTQRKKLKVKDDEKSLTDAIIALARSMVVTVIVESRRY